MWFVYILKSSITGHYYKGFTNDLDRRIQQHEHGQHISTKHMRPFSLVHVEVCNTREEARKMEKFYKSGFGREIIKEMKW